jgi:hypothetical protein
MAFDGAWAARSIRPYRLSPLSACNWAPRVSFTRLPARCSTAAANAAFATMTLRQSEDLRFVVVRERV